MAKLFDWDAFKMGCGRDYKMGCDKMHGAYKSLAKGRKSILVRLALLFGLGRPQVGKHTDN